MVYIRSDHKSDDTGSLQSLSVAGKVLKSNFYTLDSNIQRNLVLDIYPTGSISNVFASFKVHEVEAFSFYYGKF